MNGAKKFTLQGGEQFLVHAVDDAHLILLDEEALVGIRVQTLYGVHNKL